MWGGALRKELPSLPGEFSPCAAASAKVIPEEVGAPCCRKQMSIKNNNNNN